MHIKIRKLSAEAHLPEYAHGPEEDAGMDLRATAGAVLEPGLPQAIPTGLAIELPAGYEAQLRPRSGLALKHAITLPNAPATIDPGYRGEIKAASVPRAASGLRRLLDPACWPADLFDRRIYCWASLRMA